MIQQLILQWQGRGDFAEIFPLSALKGDNVAELLKVTEGYLEEGPMYYPEDAVTDQPIEVVMAELVREKVLHLTRDEVPHSIAVAVERIDRDENNKLQIDASIYVERDSQKGIIIGKQGAMLKKIGIEARKDIEYLTGEKVNLKLWVKVREDWRNNENELRRLHFTTDEA